MKYGNRVDDNQQVIVKNLRKAGYSVAIIAPCGKGIPDIIIGHNGRNYLVEIKVGNAKLTPCEKAWHDSWRGQVFIAKDTYAILEYLHERTA
jgi:hypothetical protein